MSTYATTSGQSKVLSATKNKKYYYKVRAYKTVSGKKIFGPWSAVKAYTLSNKVETVEVPITLENVNEYSCSVNFEFTRVQGTLILKK